MLHGEHIGEVLKPGSEYNNRSLRDSYTVPYPQTPTYLDHLRTAAAAQPTAATRMCRPVDVLGSCNCRVADPEIKPVPFLSGGHHVHRTDGGSSPSGEGSWLLREARDLSSAAASNLSDFGKTFKDVGSDIIHGKATLGEVGFAVGEAGIAVAIGGAIALGAGVELPVAATAAFGGLAAAFAGEMIMSKDIKS